MTTGHTTNAKRLSELTGLAIAGQMGLLASAGLLPIVSEYGLVGDNISELVLGRLGFLQTAAFLIAGLGTLGLAVAIRRVTVSVPGSFAGSLLLGIYGAGAILSAIIPTDRIDSPVDLASLSPIGTAHLAVALVSFLCVIAGMFTLTWTFMRRTRRRQPWAWLMLLPAGALSLLFVQGEGPWVGLMQRMLVTVISAWLVLVALRLRSHSIAASTESTAPVPANH